MAERMPRSLMCLATSSTFHMSATDITEGRKLRTRSDLAAEKDAKPKASATKKKRDGGKAKRQRSTHVMVTRGTRPTTNRKSSAKNRKQTKGESVKQFKVSGSVIRVGVPEENSETQSQAVDSASSMAKRITKSTRQEALNSKSDVSRPSLATVTPSSSRTETPSELVPTETTADSCKAATEPTPSLQDVDKHSFVGGTLSKSGGQQQNESRVRDRQESSLSRHQRPTFVRTRPLETITDQEMIDFIDTIIVSGGKELPPLPPLCDGLAIPNGGDERLVQGFVPQDDL